MATWRLGTGNSHHEVLKTMKYRERIQDSYSIPLLQLRRPIVQNELLEKLLCSE